jgi:hypothetical protein
MIPQSIRQKQFRRGAFFNCIVECNEVSKKDKYEILYITDAQEYVAISAVELNRIASKSGPVKVVSNFCVEYKLELEDFIELIDNNLKIKLPKELNSNEDEKILKIDKLIDQCKEIKSSQDTEEDEEQALLQDMKFLDKHEAELLIANKKHKIFIVNLSYNNMDMHFSVTTERSIKYVYDCGLYRNIREFN